MSEVYQIPLIDQHGNIAVHGRSGASLTLEFQLADGGPRDVSEAAMFFEVEGALRLPLGAGQTNDQRVLTLTREQVLTIAGRPRMFSFIDESGAIPEVFWSGTVRLFGYTEQPA